MSNEEYSKKIIHETYPEFTLFIENKCHNLFVAYIKKRNFPSFINNKHLIN